MLSVLCAGTGASQQCPTDHEDQTEDEKPDVPTWRAPRSSRTW
jgi:hypothetical protein